MQQCKNNIVTQVKKLKVVKVQNRLQSLARLPDIQKVFPFLYETPKEPKLESQETRRPGSPGEISICVSARLTRVGMSHDNHNYHICTKGKTSK